MENITTNIITQILTDFNFTYITTVVILTYLIIKISTAFISIDKITKWRKRIILILSIIIVGIIYHYVDGVRWIVLFNSAIAAPVVWSWILKPLANKFGIDYNNK